MLEGALVEPSPLAGQLRVGFAWRIGVGFEHSYLLAEFGHFLEMRGFDRRSFGQ